MGEVYRFCTMPKFTGAEEQELTASSMAMW
jgi:hypothetical protein